MVKLTKQEIKQMSRTDVQPSYQGLSRIDNLFRQVQIGMGYDPTLELIKIARGKDTSDALKTRIAMELMSYFYPKLKAVQVDPNQGEVININVTYPDKNKGTAFATSLALEAAEEEIIDGELLNYEGRASEACYLPDEVEQRETSTEE